MQLYFKIKQTSFTMNCRFILLFVTCCFIQPLFAQPSVNLIPFSGGYAQPVAIENCGDSRLFIVQQRGVIYICDSLGIKQSTPFLDLSGTVSQSGNEKGLLGLAFHPNYATNGYFYVNYTAESNGNTYVCRFTRNAGNPNIADPGSELLLLTIAQPYPNHNGGNLEFGPDGYLYIGMGDGGNGGDPQGYAQNKLSLLGKMLRIDVNSGSNYSIPATNPFVGNTQYAPEIWSLGLRNPWRFSFDPLNGNMWIGDVGQYNWEEIDFEPAGTGGLNYGWNCYEANNSYGGVCPTGAVYTFPVFSYASSMPPSGFGCSVTGGLVYRGVQFADLYGQYLFADYCSGIFFAANADAAAAPPFSFTQIKDTTNNEFSTLGTDYHGEMYVAGHLSGNIYKIRSVNCAPLARIINSNLPNNLCVGDVYTLQALTGNGFTYQWQLNGTDITGANSATYNATQTGNYAVKVGKTGNALCSSVSAAVSLDFKTTPTPQISGETVVCDNNTTEYIYSVEYVPGYLYNWSIASGSGNIVSGQNTNSVSVVWLGGAAGSIQVSVTNP
ncbi:hypothetical protein BVG80_09875 [Sphingobacteriales bacterium TSM_CSM]|nr:hypothetical protein BVG80_09875 [Sphingobacteriales bacterium TSM_CSM]